MAEQVARPLPILADIERCCPSGQCAYRPAQVAYYLGVIRDLGEAGQDAGEAADSAMAPKGESLGRSAPSSPGSCHNAIRLWDVQVAIVKLRREGREATAAALADRLCPWALEDGNG